MQNIQDNLDVRADIAPLLKVLEDCFGQPRHVVQAESHGPLARAVTNTKIARLAQDIR